MSRNDRELRLIHRTLASGGGRFAAEESASVCGETMQTLLAMILTFAGLVSIAIVVIFELRKSPRREAEMIEREDKAMSKTPDDPREMARWVP